jgi:organic hydroperoxide reductase OsmC/OhrA
MSPAIRSSHDGERGLSSIPNKEHPMSDHRIALSWSRATPSFDPASYNRGHAVTFKNGQQLAMSAALAYRGDAEMVDPEEAFVASLASCHMLTFLAIAAKGGFVVDAYADDAVGHLERNAEGRMSMTRVHLRPRIVFSGTAPDDAAFHAMHEKAHENCFIANSVKTEVTTEPEIVASEALTA